MSGRLSAVLTPFLRHRTPLALLLALLSATPAWAQAKPAAYDESWFASMRYRLVGPFRGGRSAAVKS